MITEKDLDNMKLPEVNEARQESNLRQTKLSLAISEAIRNVEKELDYKFEFYEIDNVLLDKIKHHQEAYLNTKFGYTVK